MKSTYEVLLNNGSIIKLEAYGLNFTPAGDLLFKNSLNEINRVFSAGHWLEVVKVD